MALPGKPYVTPIPCEDCQGTGFRDWEHDDHYCDPVSRAGYKPSYYKAHQPCPTCKGKGWYKTGTFYRGIRMW